LVALNVKLKELSPMRVEIYCSGNYCRDLAEDLDEAFESAGFDSYIEFPLFDIGKGIGISPDTPATQAIAAAIKGSSGGAVDFRVFDAVDAKGAKTEIKNKVIIALARRPAVPQPAQ
jgi:hypothetical protein